MLLALTSITDFVGLCTTLWLAGYLLSRGLRSAITIRAVLILLLLALSFAEGYISLHEPLKSHNAWYIAANLLAVLVWYNLTFQWLPAHWQRRLRWVAYGLYAIGLITIGLALLPSTQVDGSGPGLYVNVASTSVFVVANALLLLPAAAATLVNFQVGARYGRGPDFRAMWVATLLAALAMPYGALAYVIPFSVARLGLDWLLYAALVMLGLAVARHQAFVERRTTLQDLPVNAVLIVAIMGFYAFTTLRADFRAEQTALVTALAVGTHSVYDVAREVLDRWLRRPEAALRHQLRKLARDVGGPDSLAANLQLVLNSLVGVLRAGGGFVAVRQGQQMAVLASVRSLPVGHLLPTADLAAEEVRPGAGPDAPAAWVAPASAGNEQLGAIGLGPRSNRSPYAQDDLDLLAEAADTLGRLLQAEARQAQERAQLIQVVTDLQTHEVNSQAEAQDLIATLETPPDREFERKVEQCLRRLGDFPWLGQSPLAAELQLGGATTIERGKLLRAMLLRAIDSLQPPQARPSSGHSLPQEWQAYTILHEAYVEDVSNRDIMARLYISEGTFARRRRGALSAVARCLLETRLSAAPGQGQPA